MKPPPFRYRAPSTVDEAVAALAEAGDTGKVLAGGQSLVPLLNMRLAGPQVLVDVNRVAGLDVVEVDDEVVRVGATVRQADLERHAAASAAIPLLHEALGHVAHPVIRNRGTVVGSIAHADPAAELPAVLALLDGSVEVRSGRGSRHVPATDFFVGPLESALEPGDLATAVTFPRPAPRTGTAFVELARRHGDYAMAGVAVAVTLDGDQVGDARAAFIGVGGVPVVVDLAGDLAGQSVADLDVAPAVGTARGRIDPMDDIHATADYRRHLAGVLLGRALTTAASRAAGGDAP